MIEISRKKTPYLLKYEVNKGMIVCYAHSQLLEDQCMFPNLHDFPVLSLYGFQRLLGSCNMFDKGSIIFF